MDRRSIVRSGLRIPALGWAPSGVAIAAALALGAAILAPPAPAAAQKAAFRVKLNTAAPPKLGPRYLRTEGARRPGGLIAPVAVATPVGGADAAAAPRGGDAGVLGSLAMARTPDGRVLDIAAALSDRSGDRSGAASAAALLATPPPRRRPDAAGAGSAGAGSVFPSAGDAAAAPPLSAGGVLLNADGAAAGGAALGQAQIRVGAPIAWPAFADRSGGEGAFPDKAATGTAGYALIDIERGAVIDRRQAEAAFLPASVSKAPTAIYALETLGPDFTFSTKLIADGAVAGGALNGDLYLVGSGDPTLDTADLAALAEALALAGVRRITGRFIYATGPSATIPALDPTQPEHAAYNPAMSGLNLNFNRILYRWTRQSGGAYEVEAKAHAAKKSVDAVTVSAALLDASDSVGTFEHRFDGPEREVWAVSPRVLGRKRGSRWFPVRRPALYAASVFRQLADEAGVALPKPEAGGPPPVGSSLQMVAEHRSNPLSMILKGMLKFSTNLTAEAIGLAASAERGLDRADFAQSADIMEAWLAARYHIAVGGAARFSAIARGDGVVGSAATGLQNHSGLSSVSRMSPMETAAMLARIGSEAEIFDSFYDLMPRHKVRNVSKAVIKAKTGTMYFGRGLAGYLKCTRGKTYAFAVYSSDIRRRDAFDAIYDPKSNLKPKGGEIWLNRARRSERALLRQWTNRYCG